MIKATVPPVMAPITNELTELFACHLLLLACFSLLFSSIDSVSWSFLAYGTINFSPSSTLRLDVVWDTGVLLTRFKNLKLKSTGSLSDACILDLSHLLTSRLVML